MAGLAATYALNLSMLQGFFITNLCNLENKIISVERILQYTCITSEPPLVIEEHRPENDWPSQGEVEIYDLQVIKIHFVSCLYLRISIKFILQGYSSPKE